MFWLRRNRHLFQMEIFKPATVSLTARDRRYARAVEACFSGAQLRTLVCQCHDDYRLMNKLIIDSTEVFRRKPAKYSFDGYAVEYVKSPDGLYKFLSMDVQLHRTPITLNPINHQQYEDIVPIIFNPGSRNFITKMTMNRDWRETQLRAGGDLAGLVPKLDYLYRMGVRGIFISGTPFLNMLWQADSYSPLDFTVLDPHYGTIDDYNAMISEVHARGMYVMADFTVGTMSDLIGFSGYLNGSTPFDLNTKPSGSIPISCHGALMGTRLSRTVIWTFGVHPDWQRQLAKFASVQDYLREWEPTVMAKLTTFSCLTITALGVGVILIDKSTQATVDALAIWASATRKCAYDLGKKNFFITGEVTGGDTFGSYGRGRTPTQLPSNFDIAANLTANQSQCFLRDESDNGLDAVAFHYSTYRSLTRFFGMDGNLADAYDIDVNFVTSWNQMFVDNDFLNAITGDVDPRHMFVMPGISLIYHGEEQNVYLYDTTAQNYLYGRQAMISNKAWQRHGCHHLGSEQYYNIALDKSLIGCLDDWNSLDHFDPIMNSRRMMAHMFYLHFVYGALQNGFGLVQQGNWAYQIERPGSNGTATEIGLWSISRSDITSQTLSGNNPDEVWMLYTNEHTTKTWTYDCTSSNLISTLYQADTIVRNLFYPYGN
ncbi:glycoside hydrolase [Stereum hirsutum FP-91666 SS1]|uniref:Glycoside hydrolase n=1 Tax=Stereum hirsutum (strain FP-91666) TaxID=721885 RepID=R7RZ89_STEHR|nr:glycoside hydrolase [Stereum hirsutum FP-91666 SS1]EIM79632.1 glycoside hydrolase [Stereum hirsutum FP-91666 SS1]